MDTRDEQQIWERAQGGRHTACVGLFPAQPPSTLSVVRIRCDGPASTFGPLFEAQRDIEEILGDTGPLIELARQRVISGLRRRLLGDLPATGSEAELVDACNRLARKSAQPYALVFDALDAADDITVELIERIVQRPGWLRVPLVLVFRQVQSGSAAARLLDTLRAIEGAESVVVAQPSPDPRGADPVAWRALPAEVLRVLRAGAVIGGGFEAELIASLLDWKHADVYDCLQRAADAGIPIEDRGDGRFFLPEALVDAIRASLLPSVAAAWHRQLGILLAGVALDSGSGSLVVGPVVEAGPLDVGEEVAFEPAAPVAPMPPLLGDTGLHRVAGARAATVPDTPGARDREEQERRVWSEIEDQVTAPLIAEVEPSAVNAGARGISYADVFDADTASQPAAAPPGRSGAPGDAVVDGGDRGHAPPPAGGAAPARADAGAETMDDELPADGGPWSRLSAVRAPAAGPRRDQARAAGHLTAAGEIEAAAEHYVAAAGQASAAGAHIQAMEHVRRALTLIDRLPTTQDRRTFRIRAMLTLGRIQWQAVDPGALDDNAFTLTSALGTADAVLGALGEGDPPELVAEARSLVAGICYDLGDLRSLERALDELTQASRLLLDAGDALGAARLLNDQAAVYVRLGDPVRATHLLTQSQAVFEARAENDPVTMTELAETHHLFARLPLHARIRPGHEADAYAMGLDHARKAESWYRKLRASRELARVWETMGRLELCRDRPDDAAKLLHRALQVQSRLGDVTGLARTTAVMAEMLAARGMYRNALMVLGDSINLNLDKGSHIGLAFNRRAFDTLSREVGSEEAPDVINALDDVRQRLEQAEGLLGRAILPDINPE